MSEQQELFEADTSWFHVFKEMVKTKELAGLNDATVKVYLVIKSFTNWNDGRAFPSIETIVDYSGKSRETVFRCLKELEEKGHIVKQKIGRRNSYTLREKVIVSDTETGLPAAIATWDYAPTTAKKAILELKNMLITGDFNGAKIVSIQRLYLQQGDHNTQNNTQFQVDIGKLSKEEKTEYLRYYAEARAKQDREDDLSTIPE